MSRLWFVLLIGFMASMAFMATFTLLSEMLLHEECRDRGLDTEKSCAHSDSAHKSAAKKFAAINVAMASASFIITNYIGQIVHCRSRKLGLIVPLFGSAGSFLALLFVSSSTKMMPVLLAALVGTSLAGSIFNILATIFTITADLITADLNMDHVPQLSLGSAESLNVRSNEKALTTSFGLVEGASWLGFVVGPSLGHMIAAYVSFKATFFIASVINICLAFAAMVILKETLPQIRRGQNFEWGKSHPFFGIILLFGGSVYVRRLGTVVMVGLLAVIGVRSMIPLYLKKRFAMSTNELGWVQSLGYAAGAFGLLVILPHLRRYKFSGREIILLGMSGGCACSLCFMFIDEGWQSYLISAASLSTGLLFPVSRALFSRAISFDSRATTLAACGSLEVLSSIVGPLIFPIIYSESQGANGVPGWLASGQMVFLAGAACYLLAFAAAMTLPNTPEVHESSCDGMQQEAPSYTMLDTDSLEDQMNRIQNTINFEEKKDDQNVAIHDELDDHKKQLPLVNR